jgi:biopolymer transport protein ExbD
MKATLLFGCALLFAAVGCKRELATTQTSGAFPGQTAGIPAPAVSEWAKVKVGATGDVFVNKKKFTMDEFSAECARLKKVGGAIVLFVDSSNHTLNPSQTEVMRKVVNAGIPMKAAQSEAELD